MAVEFVSGRYSTKSSAYAGLTSFIVRKYNDELAIDEDGADKASSMCESQNTMNFSRSALYSRMFEYA